MGKFENAIHEMCAIENQAGEDNFLNNIHALAKLFVTVLYVCMVTSFPASESALARTSSMLRAAELVASDACWVSFFLLLEQALNVRAEKAIKATNKLLVFIFFSFLC